ncbi:mdm2-binding protein isoform X2 [Nematostella vectensis]|uniref:mdm2-binding protein isoform X2 n=1 Tax=Nematostella vectensis TaxID=45351 RepID=UPI002077827C|nr:mdm2-binding protein isoform X2 [Nematostella vectensis]
MDNYCIIIIDEESFNGEFARINDLEETVERLFERLLQHDEVFKQSYCPKLRDSDPVASLLCRSTQTYLSIIVAKKLQNFQESSSDCLWNPLSAPSLFHKIKESLKPCTNTHSSGDGDADDNDNVEDNKIATRLHQLADSLIGKDVSQLNVYWICAEPDTDLSRDNLLLFGALKRLQIWNGAHLTLITSHQDDSGYGELITDSWLQPLSPTVITTSHISVYVQRPSDVIWQGAIKYNSQKLKSLVSLPDFVLIQQYKEKEGLSKIIEDFSKKFEDEIGGEPWYKISGIQLLHHIHRDTIPLFMFLPVKLKLCASSHRSGCQHFMEMLKEITNEGIGLAACLSLVPSASPKTGRSTDDWMRLVKTDSYFTCARDLLPTNRRLCFITSNSEGSADVFIFRKPESFNGALPEMLTQIATHSNVVLDFASDETMTIPDLADVSVDADEIYGHQAVCDLFKDIDSIPSENKKLLVLGYAELYRKLNLGWASERLSSGQWVTLNLSNVNVQEPITDSTGLLESPEDWPERMWLRRNDPAEIAAREAKKKAPISIEQMLSLDMKETLKMFRPDGRPVRDDLSPLKPTTTRGLVQHVSINTTQDEIKRTPYPEALSMKYHGVEYCLDAHDSLTRDTEIALTHTSVVKQETLSSGAVPGIKKLETSTRNTRSSASGAKSRVGVGMGRTRGSVAEKKATTSSSKRPSPSAPETNKTAKRTRNEPSEREGADSERKEKSTKETRSQRHKRRLRQVVEATLESHGLNRQDPLFASCTERLYGLTKSFLKDLKSSHGLNDEMKRLARSNVNQVIEFEKTQSRLESMK